MPENMIAGNSIAYLEWTTKSWSKSGTLKPFSRRALESYKVQIQNPECVHAMCEDYRAGATIDRQLDEADKAAGRKIKAPMHYIWANSGFPAATGDPLVHWEKWTDTLTGTEIDAGHFAQEENPDAVISAFLPFFAN
ncbi:hypothetical protein MNBD_ALPHA11-1074 [hydrothermal vent metagenome]|uniref:Epoxide hydrolase n=1 Tax=hydrothermal vent metagenome TaxID=652676 RepID=A0A3B0UFZ7_9ZZZZ